jgi:hypothetical protein
LDFNELGEQPAVSDVIRHVHVIGRSIVFGGSRRVGTPAELARPTRGRDGARRGAQGPADRRPDPDLISTSYVERSNLTIRMQNLRFTRLTNAFSKKAQNHAHAVSLFFLYYNYCRPHQALTKAAQGIKTTPAMASGLTDHVWTVRDIIRLMDPKNPLQS